MQQLKTHALKAVDFFCGAGGMSLGLSRAGITILGGVDRDVDCRATYERNISGARFIKHDVSTLSAPELGRRLSLRRDDPFLVFVGCSPCQFWSKIRTDKSKSRRTAFLLRQFQKFIRYFRPGFVIVENVPGLQTRKQHSILAEFRGFLERHGYAWDDGIINASHYGVPQKRMRYLLIATHLSPKVSLPAPEPNPSLTVQAFIGEANGFPRIAAGHRDPTEFQHTAMALSPANLRRMQLTAKSGGSRAVWKDDRSLQIPAYKGRDDMFSDVYGRMSWDRPAPTITTRFNSFSNGRFGHPDEDRAVSIREGATLQTFPKDFVFHGIVLSSLARQIGNAVPPELARRIGQHLLSIAANG
ncbi:MAG: DNA cytosine methyltransferase [candidate division NC10 bacterium]|nr:DNA cytosine methyltransferase [candidate division NC10 bacterium]